MFQTSFYPSSGALDHMLLPGSRPCALCAHGLLPGFPRLEPAHLVVKTICSNIRSSAPEDGQNDV